MVGFIIGLLIGGFFGLFGTVLCVAAHESDNKAAEFEEFKRWNKENSDKEDGYV